MAVSAKSHEQTQFFLFLEVFICSQTLDFVRSRSALEGSLARSVGQPLYYFRLVNPSQVGFSRQVKTISGASNGRSGAERWSLCEGVKGPSPPSQQNKLQGQSISLFLYPTKFLANDLHCTETSSHGVSAFPGFLTRADNTMAEGGPRSEPVRPQAEFQSDSRGQA